MNRLVHIIETITKVFSGHFCSLVIIAMMTIVLIEVVSRYLFKRPLIVADELSAYMLLGMSFMALAYTWSVHTHIRIELVTSRLPRRARNWLRLMTLSLAFIFMIILTKACYDLVVYSVVAGERSSTWLLTPLSLVRAFMCVGCVLLWLQLIVEMIRGIRAIKTPAGVVL